MSEKFCFIEDTPPEVKILKVQYEVTKADFDLDIDLLVHDDKENQLTSVRRRKGRSVDIVPTETSYIEICFSNTYSRLSSKHVYVSIKSVKSEPLNHADVHKDHDDSLEDILDFESISASKRSISNLTNSIKSNLDESESSLSYLAASIKQDESIILACKNRIDFWAKWNLIISISIFIRQLLAIKHQFISRIEGNLSRRMSRVSV